MEMVPIPGQPSYAAAADGSVWSLKGRAPKIMKAFVRGRIGHLAVNLSHGGRYRLHSVHRLVALSFHGEPPTSGHVVMHLDDDPKNNAAVNLAYGLPSENSEQMVRHRRQAKGEKIGISRLTEDKVAHIRMALIAGQPGRSIARQYGISPSTVTDIKQEWTWRP